jgi:hypothetical protein
MINHNFLKFKHIFGSHLTAMECRKWNAAEALVKTAAAATAAA